MNILGILALVSNGNIIAVVQEERFTRVKHDQRFPIHAIEYCLKAGNLDKNDIDIVVFYDNPLYTLDRYMKNIAMERNSIELFHPYIHDLSGIFDEVENVYFDTC